MGRGKGTAAGESAIDTGDGDVECSLMNALIALSKDACRGKGLRVCVREMGEAGMTKGYSGDCPGLSLSAKNRVVRRKTKKERSATYRDVLQEF